VPEAEAAAAGIRAGIDGAADGTMGRLGRMGRPDTMVLVGSPLASKKVVVNDRLLACFACSRRDCTSLIGWEGIGGINGVVVVCGDCKGGT